MTEYISRETAKAFFTPQKGVTFLTPITVTVESLLATIDNIPPADVRPVVKGLWINYGDEYRPDIKCCVCGQRKPILLGNFNFNYCPNCGAKMEES